MGRFVKGDVVVIRFPFTDLSGSKRRPCLVVTDLARDDIIVCQITSRNKSDPLALPLEANDFSVGGLPVDSFIRPNKIFTADKSLILSVAGHLSDKKINEVISAIITVISLKGGAMFCKSCGKEIPDYSNFCLYCGISLSGIKTNEIVRKGMSLIVFKSEKRFGWGKYKIRIFVDGDFVKDFINGGSVSFETENGKHIIFCEAKSCERSDPIEINADSNEIHFSAAFPSAWATAYKLTLTKTKETERGTWE